MTKRNAEDGLASKQRAPLFARPLAMASLVALTLVFSSCAGKGGKSDSLSLPESEAALLDPSVDSAALPVIDPSVSPDAFADLKTGATGDSAGPADGAPFYNPLGGESLGRVAYMLYGSRSERKKLLDLNPGLRGVRALAPGQTVVFSFDGLRPNPQYLTKDLLDRYSGPLAEAVRGVGKDSKQNDTVVAKGETLQEVSKRLYGTTRYWPEIYLLNVDRIKHYDKVQAGATLAVVERSALNLGSATTAPVDSQMVAGQGAFNGPVTPAPPQEMIPPPPIKHRPHPLSRPLP